MPKYSVLTPVKHDGKRYGVGDKLTLKAEEAAGLLEAGAISAADHDAAAEKAAAEKAAAEKAAAEKAAAEKAPPPPPAA